MKSCGVDILGMKNTKDKILALIKQNPGISAKSILARFDLTRAMIFRHLKKLLAEGQITKIGRQPKVTYFHKYNLEDKTELEKQFFSWALTGDEQYAKAEWLCSTRDVFQAREEKLLLTLKNMVNEDLLYLLVGAVGEIGNNSFDHNLGNWRDTAGVLFVADVKAREIILVDRGQGVLATIKRVRPQTKTDKDALLTAFTEIISGRYPEQRGNGLKYVKKIIQENNLYLEFYSGNAMVKIANGNFTLEEAGKIAPGTLAIIKF
ncbi:MAG: winged helix-turn-helix domain-containing protein [Patescibacteria group bacterium]